MEQLEIEQFKMRIKQDYVKLLDLFTRVIAADNYLSFGDADDNERLSIARGLTNKFIEHAVTVLYLSRGTNQDLISFKFSFFDSSSINVLVRTSLEAFLTFHYVFYTPATDEERDYRYWAYKAAGIVERENTPTSTKEYKEKQAAEKEELSKLREKLKSNTVFQNLNSNQKKRILKGEWRLMPWRVIAIDAGLSKIIASQMYSLLAGYAHSGILSVVQAVEAHRDREDEESVSSSMGVMNAVTANMIREYCGLFPKAHEIWGTNREVRELVEWWIQLVRGLDDLTSKAQENDKPTCFT